MNLFKKSEKGSITIFVLTAMLLFLVVIVGVFVLYSNKVSDQQRVITRIQNEYSTDNIDEVYNSEASKSLTIAQMVKNGENCPNNGEGCTDETHLHIGDYVNYQNPTTGSYTAYSDKTGVEWDQTFNVDINLKWRILGIEEKTGRVKLIADTILEDESSYSGNIRYFEMVGTEAYMYGPGEMNNISAIYKKEFDDKGQRYADEARSININDINEALGMTDGKGNLDVEKMKQNNAITQMGGIQYGKTMGPFTEYNWTPEAWVEGVKPQKPLQDEVSAYAYYIGTEEGMVEPKNSTLKTLLFDNVEFGTGNTYRLASSGVYARSDGNVAVYGLGVVYDVEGLTMVTPADTFMSNGAEYDAAVGRAGVRPVVVLNSEVNNDQLQKVSP